MSTPNAPMASSPEAPRPNPDAAPPWWHDRLKVTVVAMVGVLAVTVTVLLLMLVNGGGVEGATATVTPTPSSPASVESLAPSPSAFESIAESTATPRATTRGSASPTPIPQAELARGWVKIETALNLRDSPDQDAPIITRLPAGEVVWVGSEPQNDFEVNWFSVETLNDKYGWISSGPADDPYATSLSNKYTFTSCGPVQLVGNSGLVAGLRTGRLQDAERAAFELAIATGTRGCQRFSNEDYEPTARLVLEAHACGAPSWDGATMTLSPTTAGDVDDAWRVSSTLTVPDMVLSEGRASADGLTNKHRILILGSRLPNPFGCVGAEILRGKSRQHDLSAEMTGCLVQVSKGPLNVVYAPATGGEAVTLARRGRNLADVVTGDPNVIMIHGRTESRYSENLASEFISDC